MIRINGNDSEPQFSKRIVDLPLHEVPENDFPIRVVYNSIFCLVFIYTKFGFVYVVEPISGVCVMQEKYSDSPLYLITSSLDCGSHFVLNRRGDIINTSIGIESFFGKCIDNGQEYYESAGIFMNNLSVEKQSTIYRNQFDKMKNMGMYQESLLLIAHSGKPFLRTFEYLSSIKDFPNINDTSALLEYFALVLESGKLNEVESLELVQLALSKKKLDIVRKWLVSDQIYCTAQLGKVVLETDPELALQIFEKSGSESMKLYCLAILGKFEELSLSLTNTETEIDSESIISTLLKSKIEYVPTFLSTVFASRPAMIDFKTIQLVLNADLGSFSAEVDEILAKQYKILSSTNSQEINTKLAIRLVDSNSDLFSEFVKKSGEYGLQLSREEILPLLKKDESLIKLAFSFESNVEECIKLSDHMVGKEDTIKSTGLSKADVKALIFTLIENEGGKYHKLCVKMGEFIDESDFDEVKELFRSNLSEELFCHFLVFWSRILKSNLQLSEDLFQLILKLEDNERLVDICYSLQLPNPKHAFTQISVCFNLYCRFLTFCI